MLARLHHHTWSSVQGIKSNATKPHFRDMKMCITHHVFSSSNEHSYSTIMQVEALLLKLISPIPPPRDAYYNAHKEYELGSMEVLKEVPFGRVVMGLLVFLKVGIILVLWCLQWGLNFLVSHQTHQILPLSLSLSKRLWFFSSSFFSFNPHFSLNIPLHLCTTLLLDFSHFFTRIDFEFTSGPKCTYPRSVPFSYT